MTREEMEQHSKDFRAKVVELFDDPFDDDIEFDSCLGEIEATIHFLRSTIDNDWKASRERNNRKHSTLEELI